MEKEQKCHFDITPNEVNSWTGCADKILSWKKQQQQQSKQNKTNKKSQTAWSDTVTLLSYIVIADFALVSVSSVY